VIRQYRAADYDAVSRVCLLTAEGGGDATGRYSSDDLMPDIFARPYVSLVPELAFVVEIDGAVVGYILGVADTRAFVGRFRSEWMPRIEAAYHHAQPVLTKDDLIRHLGFWPERMLIAEVDDYPAHLHIDLLPEAQGLGLGRRLVDTLIAALRERDVAGLHLTMDAANTGARAFYDRLGFTELPSSTPESPTLGMLLRHPS